MENCIEFGGQDNKQFKYKHEFRNSWGSSIHGYHGMCKCTRVAHASELAKAYLDGSAILEDMLIQQLYRHGYLTIDSDTPYWFCQSCNDIISIDEGRLTHFENKHNFH